MTNSTHDEMIVVKNVNHQFKKQAEDLPVLKNINLKIAKNEFVCVIGPSGSGKSTLLKILAGYLIPSSGSCEMHGKKIIAPDVTRGVVFQSPTLYPWLTVRRNIEYGPRIRKEDATVIREKSQAYIEKVGLADFEESHTYELSGGMKQRVALARTLINEPELILMDEPFSALDAITRMSMQTLIRNLWQDSQQTIFLITHDIEEALKLGTRIIVMSKRPGQIEVDKKIDFSRKILSDPSYLLEEDQEFHEHKIEFSKLLSK
ncbi:ABC transporter ATP-binding protein [Vagococcus elongatus]|uniref:ABC transporter ATP-binding protein n=1 Tax=Vagococcus elongatus TaxID=180344 RepID=A0A430B5A5_9ENTE|nr:ABC transporter ATP-binding protein [Vagococcus elongatus]RSU15540.1 ABC transporter ATP-binding protein [Vagococcus elongatus]